MTNKINTGNVIDVIEQEAIEAAQDTEQYEQVDCPLVHTFTPGLYSRQITMRAGLLVTSETHKTEHQYILLKGVVSVWTEAEGEIIISAPYHGVTLPGTRRLLYIHEDAIWTCFHSTLLHTVAEIHEDIIEKYENPRLKGHYENNVFVPEKKTINHAKI